MDIFTKCSKFTAAKEVMAANVYPYFIRVDSAQGATAIVEGKERVVICSNNYLGLANHPKVKEAAIAAVKKYGTSCTGSRFLNGTIDLHLEAERKFARFVGKESAILFTTGHHANLGAISTIVGKGDYVLTDKLDHASIIDGCRLSYGEMLRFRHNNIEDLERVLSRYKDAGKLIVVDGIFSMEGDIADLPEIVKLARAYNARVMVDDAHSLGVLGEHGRGTAEHFKLESEVDIIMGTASKSLASIGGFIAGREEVIHYIKHVSRSLIFTASLPPSNTAAISAALDVIEDEPERREQLWRNVRKMKREFTRLGFDTGGSNTPIIPITVGENMAAFQMWRILYDEGIFASPVVAPAVPDGHAIIRTSYTAAHTAEQLDFVLEKFAKAGKILGIISGGASVESRKSVREFRADARFKLMWRRLKSFGVKEKTQSWIKKIWGV
ncbi:MAG: aminotransferase class I/II-fold pyridoxal phosphate-dependent enzyme [Endomicrobiia bacterium]|nr:aminotransferase class I/II-fold pyridoxal phosphate-dependent enzyme [Endomicrobiia bacterium]